MFAVRKRLLPHDGIIPGARGHKKVVVPKGTAVYTVQYNSLMYWACYLDEPTAKVVSGNLLDCVEGRARRSIPLTTLLAFNFKSEFPIRVCRRK